MANYTPQEIERFLQEFFDVVGTRQYIGARYVPMFGRKGETSISWDDSVPYEPLTIVLYRNNSYTSRTYVPAGTPITDTDFWVQTGNYNAQVEAYRQETIAVTNRMDYLEDIIPNDGFTPSHTVKAYIEERVDEAAQNIEGTVDAKVDAKVPWPLTDRLGTEGQVLRTNANGTTQWADPNLPSEELMRDAVDDWLDSHQEVVTPDLTILEHQNTYWPLVPMQAVNDALGTEAKIQLQTRNGIWNELYEPSTSANFVTITPLIYLPPFTRVTVEITDTTLYYRARFKELSDNLSAWKNSSRHAWIAKSDGAAVNSFTTGFDTITAQTRYAPIIVEIDVRNADTSALAPEAVTLTAQFVGTECVQDTPQAVGTSRLLASLLSLTRVSPSNTNVNICIDDAGGGIACQGYTLQRFVLTPDTSYIVELRGQGSRALLMSSNYMDGSHIDGPIIEGPGTFCVDSGDYVRIAMANDSSMLDDCGLFTADVTSDPSPQGFSHVNVFYSKGKVLVVPDGPSTFVRDGTVLGTLTPITPESGYFELTPLANHLCFIVYTGSDVVMRTEATLDPSDFILAMCHTNSHRLFPMMDGVVVQELPLPDTVRKRSGILNWLNTRAVSRPIVTLTTTNVTDFGYFYRFGDTYNSYLVSTGHTYAGNTVKPHLLQTSNATDIGGKKILTVGDSFTNRGWYQQRILYHEPTVEFVGTRTTQHNNLLAEGYSGLSATEVLCDPTLTLVGGQVITNPFYDTNLGRCTLEYYCRTTGIVPDYVVIEFMLNESDSDDYVDAIQDFIDSIKTYDEDITVYVLQMSSDAATMASTNAITGQRRDIQRQCLLNTYQLTDCVLVPCWYILVDEYDYPHAQIPYGIGDAVVDGLSDSVHPSEDEGFAKLGDQIYNYLGTV